MLMGIILPGYGAAKAALFFHELELVKWVKKRDSPVSIRLPTFISLPIIPGLAGGTVVKKVLRNETLRVDTGCLVAFTTGIDYSIESAGNLKSMFFGGEGFFLATLRGTGFVLLQSLPFSRMADRILQHAPAAGGSRKGEGSLLGTLGDLIDGDNR